jgi:hypothetical protein
VDWILRGNSAATVSELPPPGAVAGAAASRPGGGGGEGGVEPPLSLSAIEGDEAASPGGPSAGAAAEAGTPNLDRLRAMGFPEADCRAALAAERSHIQVRGAPRFCVTRTRVA